MEFIGLLAFIWAIVSIVATVTIFSINGKIDTILQKMNGNGGGIIDNSGNNSGSGFIDISGTNQSSN